MSKFQDDLIKLNKNNNMEHKIIMAHINSKLWHSKAPEADIRECFYQPVAEDRS